MSLTHGAYSFVCSLNEGPLAYKFREENSSHADEKSPKRQSTESMLEGMAPSLVGGVVLHMILDGLISLNFRRYYCNHDVMKRAGNKQAEKTMPRLFHLTHRCTMPRLCKNSTDDINCFSTPALRSDNSVGLNE